MAVLSAVEPIVVERRRKSCAHCHEIGHYRTTCPRIDDPPVLDGPDIDDATADCMSDDMLTASMILDLDRLNSQIESLESRRDAVALNIAKRRGIR